MESPSSFARSLSFSLLSPPARPRQGRHKRRRTRPRRPRPRSRSCRRAVGPPLRPRRSPTTTSRSAKPSLGSLKCKHEKRECWKTSPVLSRFFPLNHLHRLWKNERKRPRKLGRIPHTKNENGENENETTRTTLLYLSFFFSSPSSSSGSSLNEKTAFSSPLAAPATAVAPKTAGTMYRSAGWAALKTFIMTIVVPRPRT